eukprot:TRINITY_DN12803_c0_g1_i1.p1 TRINITY_DN12803_c0_g1~~TRINITY_DN12803_c0_g1_i1.p1  ORF type:complete len:212 (-),score=26.73 TRINITY_DN12803_c0_g1_i1:387-1022(-)
MSHSGDDVAFDSPQEHEDDYHGKKHRTIFSSEQKAALEKLFLHNPFPDKKQREELAASIGVTNPKSVDYWFGHRRAKNRQHVRQHDDYPSHRVPTSTRHRDEREYHRHRESPGNVPDYYNRASDEEYSQYAEDDYSSRHYNKAAAFAAYTEQQRNEFRRKNRDTKPEVPQLVSTASGHKRKMDAFERPENQSLEELWVACLLNHFYVDARQ